MVTFFVEYERIARRLEEGPVDYDSLTEMGRKIVGGMCARLQAKVEKIDGQTLVRTKSKAVRFLPRNVH